MLEQIKQSETLAITDNLTKRISGCLAQKGVNLKMLTARQLSEELKGLSYTQLNLDQESYSYLKNYDEPEAAVAAKPKKMSKSDVAGSIENNMECNGPAAPPVSELPRKEPTAAAAARVVQAANKKSLEVLVRLKQLPGETSQTDLLDQPHEQTAHQILEDVFGASVHAQSLRLKLAEQFVKSASGKIAVCFQELRSGAPRQYTAQSAASFTSQVALDNLELLQTSSLRVYNQENGFCVSEFRLSCQGEELHAADQEPQLARGVPAAVNKENLGAAGGSAKKPENK